MAKEHVSMTIDSDILEAVHIMRGDVPVARFFSNLAREKAIESGLLQPSRQVLQQAMFE